MGFIEKDFLNSPVTHSVILAKKSGEKLGVLLIEEKSLVIKVSLEDSYILHSEMSCDVNKTINGTINPLWESVKDFRLVYIPVSIPHIRTKGFWYEISVSIDDYNNTVKHITGTLAQRSELEQAINYEVEIRTEDDIDRDDYIDTVFYNETEPNGSIVHRILKDKAPHYSIYHVDDSLKNIKRTFEFNNKDIVSCLKEVAEEIDCIIIFGETDVEDTDFHRTISFYDGKDYCPACGKRGDFSNGCTNPDCEHNEDIIYRYGDDMGLFINKENLGDNINLTCEKDNVKNYYRLSAGDDDMTATVVNCNPSGSRYIWVFTPEMKQDMSDSLLTAVSNYQTLYDDYRFTTTMTGITSGNITNYNNLVNQYNSYSEEELYEISDPIVGYTNLTKAYYHSTYLYDFLNTIMMPYSSAVSDTTAQEQLALFTKTTIGVKGLAAVSQTTAASEVKEAVKITIDTSRYDVTVTTTNYSKPTWTGTITLTSLIDEEDTAFSTKTIRFSEATDDYVKEQVETLINKKEVMITGIVNLLKLSNNDFTLEMNKYCLNSLSNISSVISAALDIMIDAEINTDTTSDVYTQLYVPYSTKKTIVDTEIISRENEIQIVQDLISELEIEQDSIHEALDIRSYLGETLWLELMSFKREEEIENSNYISDGLTINELIDNAMEFFDRAYEDIAKKAESQYTISCTLKDLLLLLPETYDRFINLFDVGNWMRIEVDEKIYKLRLVSYQINYNDLSSIQVEFSDCKKSNDIFSTFAEFKKTTAANTKELIDVTKGVKEAKTTSQIINNIFQIEAPPNDGETVAVLSCQSVVLDNGQNLEEYLKEVKIDNAINIDDAANKANNYISADNTGLMVADMSNGTQYKPNNVSTGIKNTFVNENSFNVRDGRKILSSFGARDIVQYSINNEPVFWVSHFPRTRTSTPTQALFKQETTVQSYIELNRSGFTLQKIPVENTPITISCIIAEGSQDYSHNFSFIAPDQSTIQIRPFEVIVTPRMGEAIGNNYSIEFDYYSGMNQPPTIKIETNDFSDNALMTVIVQYYFLGSDIFYYPFYTLGTRKDYEQVGAYSFAEGLDVKAIGDSSHAEGILSIATGTYSHAEGNGTLAHGYTSHAEGYFTETYGDYSHAQNKGTIALQENQTAIGAYNIEDEDDKYAFIIGNGSNTNDRHNAFAVSWWGDLEFDIDPNNPNSPDTKDVELYNAITALGWGNEVII